MTAELASVVALNQGLRTKMAVGSNVETVSDTTDVQQTSYHTRDGENCFGLPYEDHNYGAPRPRPPTPPLSPHSVYVSDDMESDRYSPLRVPTENNLYLKQAHQDVKSSQLKQTSPVQNGMIRLNAGSVSQKKDGCPQNIPFKATLPERDIIRCICGYSHDDGYTICCDQCGVWQHMDCMNIDRNSIPEAYYCDGCHPRTLNKKEAKQLQARKLDDLSMASEIEASETESGDEKDHAKVTYSSVRSTPTSLTLNRISKKPVGKKRKRPSQDDKISRLKGNVFRKRSRSASKSNDSTDDDNIGAFRWTSKLKEWQESYNELDENFYTPELLQAVLSSSKKFNEVHDKRESVLSQLRKQLARVQQLKYKIMAMEDIDISMPVAELCGSYMLSKQTEVTRSAIRKRPYPHVFFYNGFDGLEVVADCRTQGNSSRYLRRSCCPNCEIRHVTEDNRLHLFVYSKHHIPSGSEITIPFDFKYQNCLYDVECGCGKFEDCPVYNFNHRLAMAEEAPSKQRKYKDESGNKVSPLRFPASRIQERVPTNGLTSPSCELPSSGGTKEQDSQLDNQRKKSREDRKIDSYIRIIEKMEKQEKRKEQLQHSRSTSLNSIVIPTQDTVAPCESPLDEGSISHTVNAMKRSNRRRSTKGSRRNVRKGRGASFEGVMSPTLSVDNDSSSLMEASAFQEIADLTSDSLQSLPPLTIEPSTDSVSAQECFAAEDHSNSACFASQTPREDTSQGSFGLSSPNCATDNATSQTEANINFANDVFSQTENDCNKNLQADNTALREENVENNVQSLESQTVINISKPARKKSGNTLDTATGSTAKSDPAKSSATQLSEAIKNCSFKPWDYRPGVPTGQVHVGVGIRKGRKYFGDLIHNKKIWLNMAKDENLISVSNNSASDDGHNATNARSGRGFKKRLLTRYAAVDGAQQEASLVSTSLGASDDASTAIQVDVEEKRDPELLMIRDQSSCSVITATSTLTQQNPVQSIGAQETGHSAAVSGMNWNTDKESPRDAFSVEGQNQATHYENLTDDDDDNSLKAQPCNSPASPKSSVEEPQHVLWPRAPTRLNGELEPNAALQAPYYQQLSNDTRALPLQPLTGENSRNASTKKKVVSLQEYWKRNKESRSSISKDQENQSQTPSLAPTSTTTPADVKTTTTSSSPVVTSIVQSLPKPVTSSSSSASLTKPERKSGESDSVKDINEILTASTKGRNNVDVSILANCLSSEGALKSLTPQVLNIVNELISNGSISEDKAVTKTKPESAETKSLSTIEKGTSRLLSSDLNESKTMPSTPVTPVLARPHIERSNSSPGNRRSFHSPLASGKPGQRTFKKSSSSHQSSPSNRPSSSSSSVTLRKGLTSPSTASPRSTRGYSGSSLSSQSPTPTIFDQRHRNDHTLGKVDSLEGGSSRHSRSASSDSSSQSRSPKPACKDSATHHSDTQSRVRDQPQKVPSLTPAVPGQPIPSLARGPGASRTPQMVYNRGASPRRDTHPIAWDDHFRDTSSRSLKDVPYTHQDPYYPPPRPYSPGNQTYDYSRPGHDKHYYDRYPTSPPRRDDDIYPPKPPPPNYYYHHSPYHQKPYHTNRPLYYPPRETRPPSPGPPPRSSHDYYSKPGGYRPPNYFPPADYRR